MHLSGTIENAPEKLKYLMNLQMYLTAADDRIFWPGIKERMNNANERSQVQMAEKLNPNCQYLYTKVGLDKIR